MAPFVLRSILSIYSDDMTPEEEIHGNIQSLVDDLTKITVRIATWDAGVLKGRSSGFLYKSPNHDSPLVITAGHNMPDEGSFIETRVKNDNGEMLQINAGKFQAFYNRDKIDVAFSELPIDLYKKEIAQYDGVELFQYFREFVKAIPGEAYSFAVINNYEFVKSGNGFILPVYLCYEIGLELVDQDESFNYFKTCRNFQGHEYYQGASGSPIIDPEGAVTSILVSGFDDIEVLRGFRLDNFDFKSGIAKKS